MFRRWYRCCRVNKHISKLICVSNLIIVFPSYFSKFKLEFLSSYPCFQVGNEISKLVFVSSSCFQVDSVSKWTFTIYGDFWGFYFLEANISTFYFSVFVNLEKIILKNFCQTLSLKKGLYTPIHVYSCITLNHFELPILGPLSRTDSAAQRETGALQALQKARNLEFDRNFTSISNFNKNCNHFY